MIPNPAYPHPHPHPQRKLPTRAEQRDGHRQEQYLHTLCAALGNEDIAAEHSLPPPSPPRALLSLSPSLSASLDIYFPLSHIVSPPRYINTRDTS